MLKTYITTVPLQGKLDPMFYQRDHVTPPVATCFPIVQRSFISNVWKWLPKSDYKSTQII